MPRWSDEPVTFDRFDTLHSAKSKLASAASGQPVVILAPSCRIARNVLLYRLLARTSQELGGPIAVVARSSYWRKLAREHGLRAFPSVGALERSARRTAGSIAESLADALYSSLTPSFSRQGWVILIALLLVAGTAAYLFLPVMNVTIQTPVEQISQDVVAKVDASVSSLDVSSSLIPGRVIEYRFTVSDTVTTTGEKNVGKDRAKGEVTVINSTPSLITIPAGTVLSTGSGQKFSTSTAVAVGSFQQSSGAFSLTPQPTPRPGATPTAGSATAAGTTMRVPVVAVEAGEKGNVPALAISNFEADSFRGLTVFNEQALTGGTDQKSKVASADDRSRLREAIFQRAQSQALAELQARVRQSESLIPPSMQVRVEKEDYDKNVDEEGDKLNGTLSVVATAIGFSNTDLNTLVERQWRDSVPKGYRALPAALAINPPEILQGGSQTASLKVRAAGRAERVLEADSLSQALRGLSVQDAKEKLSQLESPLRLVKLEMWPGWAGRAFRVEVQTTQ
jgi:hypothetical protein